MTEEKIIIDKKERGETNKDYLYRCIRKNIIYNHMEPGSAISENYFAELFQVSRTPIRETITKLVREELLEVFPQKGTYVSKIDTKRVWEATFMRKALETEAAQLACEKMSREELFALECNVHQQSFFYEENRLEELLELDNQFHKLMYEICGLERIWECLQNIGADQERIRYLKLKDRFQWDTVLEEHKQIVEDLRQKDKERIKRELVYHIDKIHEDTRIIRKKYPQYFVERKEFDESY